MNINYTWSIPELKKENSTGFVYQVRYILTGSVDVDGVTYSDTIGGIVDLLYPNDALHAYESLTEEIVSSWVESYLGNEKVNQLKAKIAETIRCYSLTETSFGIPW